MWRWLWLLCLCLPAQAITLQDDSGNTITLAAPAQRIVSLAPSITENLFAIGAGSRLVGTSTASDYPLQARSIPIVADYQSVNLERIATLHPDLIIAWQGGNSPAQLSALAQLNIPVYMQGAQTLADIPLNLMRLAQLTGREAEAAPSIVAAYQKIGLWAQAPKPQLSAFFQVWHEPLMTLNRNSWISDAMTRCGARNLFADAPITAPTVNIETVLQHNPALIITASPNGLPNRDLDVWRSWPQLAAVQHQGLLFTDADAMNRATLRTLDAAQALCSQIAARRH